MTFASAVLARLASTDRALLHRSMTHTGPRARAGWIIVTHIGGLRASLVAALPMVTGGPLAVAARNGLLILVLSHILVQVVKRTVGRPRPSSHGTLTALVLEPDQFSFPSGHSAAVMSYAIAYAVAFPVFSIPLVMLAVLVGMSRVCLGVHYPGDVLAGQMLSATTAFVLFHV